MDSNYAAIEDTPGRWRFSSGNAKTKADTEKNCDCFFYSCFESVSV
jgi:hypothetical protein